MEAKMTKKFGKVTSLASTCWMGLLVVGAIGIALNWNLFLVLGVAVVAFGAGLGVIYLPGFLKAWHAREQARIEKKAHELAEKMKPSDDAAES